MWDLLPDDDGYTQRVFIKEHPRRVHGELRLMFRPIAHLDQVRQQEAVKKADVVDGERAAAKSVTERLVAWSLKDRSGNPVPITEDVLVKRLNPVLYARIMSIVYFQNDAGDEDPLASVEEDKNPYTALERLAKNG